MFKTSRDLGIKMMLTAIILIGCFSVSMRSPISKAAAFSGPTVVVVRDVTFTSHCLAWTKHDSKKVACAAGTILESFNVPLAVAQASHEKYILLPARTASAAQFSAFHTQLEALKNALFQIFHPTPVRIIKPLTNCGSNGAFYTTFGHDNNSWEIYGEVETDRYNYCNLDVNNSIVQGVNIGEAWYWGKDQYAGSIWHHGCTFIGNSIYNWPPYKVINGGYYWEQVFYHNDSGCNSGSQIWDNMGPMS